MADKKLPFSKEELENIIEHAFVRTTGNVISASKLPIYLRQSGSEPSARRVQSSDDLTESQEIRRVLLQCHWNRKKAADQLGVSRTTLWRRMKDLDLLEEGRN